MNKSVVHYNVMRHGLTKTAPQTAEAVGLPGKAFIKAVVVTVDSKPVLCVLCSHHEVDLRGLQQLAGASTVEHASEADIHTWLPSIEVCSVTLTAVVMEVLLLLLFVQGADFATCRSQCCSEVVPGTLLCYVGGHHPHYPTVRTPIQYADLHRCRGGPVARQEQSRSGVLCRCSPHQLLQGPAFTAAHTPPHSIRL